MMRDINKKIKHYAKRITEYATMLENYETDGVMRGECAPLLKRLVADSHSLMKNALKYANNVGTDSLLSQEEITIPSVGNEGSFIRAIKYVPSGICITVDVLPSKSNEKAAIYSYLLRQSLLAIPEDARKEILEYNPACLIFRRVHLPKSLKTTYDIDNGAYSAVINALQGVLLKSERIEHLRSLTIEGVVGNDEHLEIEIHKFTDPN